MLLVKILKRKDASSLIVGVVIASVLWQALIAMTGDLASTLSGLKDGHQVISYAPPDANWRQMYAYPTISAALQIIALELLAWVILGVSLLIKGASPVKTKKKR